MKTRIGILSADYQGELLAKILLKKGFEVTILSEGNTKQYFNNFYLLNKLGFCSLYSLSDDNLEFARKVLELNVKKTIQEKHLLIDTTIYKYPLQLRELLKHTSYRFAFSSILDLIYRYIKISKISNYEQYIRKYYSNILFKFYFEKYLKNEFPSIKISDLDIELAYRRVRYVTLYDVIKKIILNDNENIYNTKYYYSAQMNELLYNKSIESGCVRIDNVSLDKITCNGFYNVYYSANSKKHEISFDKLYSLLPITKLHGLLYHQKRYKELQWTDEYVYSYKIKKCSNKFPDGLFYIANSSVSFFQLSKISINEDEHICNVLCNVDKLTNKSDLENKIWNEFYSINLLDCQSSLISCTYYLFEHNKPILTCGFDMVYKKLLTEIENKIEICLVGTKAKFEEFSFDQIINELILIDKTL